MEEMNQVGEYAIFAFGGKQYQAVEGKTLAVEKIDVPAGSSFNFDKVLLVRKSNEEIIVGKPFIDGISIKAEIISHNKGPKLIVFRFKRRKRIRVKNGHRQPQTIVRFSGLSTDA